MNRDRLYVLHMLECIARIESYTAVGREAFVGDEKSQDATLRNLHTLAESSKRLSEEIKETEPDIDWRGIRGFRNVLVHDYLGMDVHRVWQVVEEFLPELKAALGRMSALLDADDEGCQ